MNAVVNHVYPVCQSCFWRMSITIYACSTFPIEDEAFLPTVFYERSTSRQGTVIDEGVHYASIQVGQRFYDTVFPSRRGSG
jgi:hypothetical protein